MKTKNDVAILFELIKTLEATETLDHLFSVAIQQLESYLDYNLIAILMFDAEENLEMKHCSNMEVKQGEKNQIKDKELFKKEFQEKQLKIYYRKQNKELLKTFFLPKSVKKVVIAPFITKNRLVGFLCLGKHDDSPISDEEKLLLEACAFSISFTINNLIVRKELTKQNKKLQIIAKKIRHDFANDLQSIGMTIELLLTTELSDEQSKFIRLLKNAKDSAVRRLKEFKELKNEFEKEVQTPYGLILE